MGRAGADQYHKEVEGSGKGRGCTKPVIPVMSTVVIFDGDDRDQVQDKSQVRVNARGIRMARHGEKVTRFVVHRAVEVERLSKGKMENGGSGGETFVNILVE